MAISSFLGIRFELESRKTIVTPHACMNTATDQSVKYQCSLVKTTVPSFNLLEFMENKDDHDQTA